MKQEIQSKETIYNGYRFRSRLEARWAVFFDALGIKYHYEYQDFMLPSGRYLPDFFLPDFEGGCYCEVKPSFDQTSIDRCIELFLMVKKYVVLLDGPPDFKCQRLICEKDEGYWEGDFGENELPEFKVTGSKVDFSIVLFCADQASGENRFFWEPGYQEEDLTISDRNMDCLGGIYIDAVNESRAARFEFQR